MPAGQELEFSGLTKRFGPVEAVSDLTVRVRPGVVTGFLGPNGAGKSTTLRMLLGLVRPTAGSATIGGRRYAELDDPVHTVGAVLEATSFHPGRTGRNHLRVFAQAGQVDPARVDAVLAAVGLTEAADRKVGGYSLGMRQRLALATALLGDPGVLVLDEPTNGLDPEGITWMRDTLRALAAEGRTVLVSSHMLAEVQQTADDLIVIANGRLVFHGDFDDLLADEERPTVVDAPDRAALTSALSAAGITFNVLRSGITVRGATPTAVGAIAADAGVPLSALQRRGPSLEDVFFDLVSGTRVHPSGNAASAAPAVGAATAENVTDAERSPDPETAGVADDAADVAATDTVAPVVVPAPGSTPTDGITVAAAAVSADSSAGVATAANVGAAHAAGAATAAAAGLAAAAAYGARFAGPDVQAPAPDTQAAAADSERPAVAPESDVAAGTATVAEDASDPLAEPEADEARLLELHDVEDTVDRADITELTSASTEAHDPSWVPTTESGTAATVSIPTMPTEDEHADVVLDDLGDEAPGAPSEADERRAALDARTPAGAGSAWWEPAEMKFPLSTDAPPADADAAPAPADAADDAPSDETDATAADQTGAPQAADDAAGLGGASEAPDDEPSFDDTRPGRAWWEPAPMSYGNAASTPAGADGSSGPQDDASTPGPDGAGGALASDDGVPPTLGEEVVDGADEPATLTADTTTPADEDVESDDVVAASTENSEPDTSTSDEVDLDTDGAPAGAAASFAADTIAIDTVGPDAPDADTTTTDAVNGESEAAGGVESSQTVATDTIAADAAIPDVDAPASGTDPVAGVADTADADTAATDTAAPDTVAMDTVAMDTVAIDTVAAGADTDGFAPVSATAAFTPDGSTADEAGAASDASLAGADDVAPEHTQPGDDPSDDPAGEADQSVDAATEAPAATQASDDERPWWMPADMTPPADTVSEEDAASADAAAADEAAPTVDEEADGFVAKTAVTRDTPAEGEPDVDADSAGQTAADDPTEQIVAAEHADGDGAQPDPEDASTAPAAQPWWMPADEPAAPAAPAAEATGTSEASTAEPSDASETRDPGSATDDIVDAAGEPDASADEPDASAGEPDPFADHVAGTDDTSQTAADEATETSPAPTPDRGRGDEERSLWTEPDRTSYAATPPIFRRPAPPAPTPAAAPAPEPDDSAWAPPPQPAGQPWTPPVNLFVASADDVRTAPESADDRAATPDADEPAQPTASDTYEVATTGEIAIVRTGEIPIVSGAGAEPTFDDLLFGTGASPASSNGPAHAARSRRNAAPTDDAETFFRQFDESDADEQHEGGEER